MMYDAWLQTFKGGAPVVARLWRNVRNAWMGSAKELHGHVSILVHRSKFCIQRQTTYQPCGLWHHVLESVWAQEKASTEEEKIGGGVCCQLCADHLGDVSQCGSESGICHLNMCASCMPLQICIFRASLDCFIAILKNMVGGSRISNLFPLLCPAVQRWLMVMGGLPI